MDEIIISNLNTTFAFYEQGCTAYLEEVEYYQD